MLERTGSCGFADEIRSIVDEVLPMEGVAEAHQRVEAETRLGAWLFQSCRAVQRMCELLRSGYRT